MMVLASWTQPSQVTVKENHVIDWEGAKIVEKDGVILQFE